jgi:hypothetical protein
MALLMSQVRGHGLQRAVSGVLPPGLELAAVAASDARAGAPPVRFQGVRPRMPQVL